MRELSTFLGLKTNARTSTSQGIGTRISAVVIAAVFSTSLWGRHLPTAEKASKWIGSRYIIMVSALNVVKINNLTTKF